ncbi:hypothetical protein EFR84_04675 [Rhizobium chutanense]|uniref:Uncharacterized protein n=1 Tax=Rhizobium chutanense TaxID=2035448 RepID=A0A432P7U9_9HYPH|nr:hypothetical protein EFR84_04675 [Rhizobium chutanense]
MSALLIHGDRMKLFQIREQAELARNFQLALDLHIRRGSASKEYGFLWLGIRRPQALRETSCIIDGQIRFTAKSE